MRILSQIPDGTPVYRRRALGGLAPRLGGALPSRGCRCHAGGSDGRLPPAHGRTRGAVRRLEALLHQVHVEGEVETVRRLGGHLHDAPASGEDRRGPLRLPVGIHQPGTEGGRTGSELVVDHDLHGTPPVALVEEPLQMEEGHTEEDDHPRPDEVPPHPLCGGLESATLHAVGIARHLPATNHGRAEDVVRCVLRGAPPGC